MSLFGKNNAKIRREKQDSINKVYIDFKKVKDRTKFRTKLLKDLLGDNSVLVVIDTKLAYQRQEIPDMIGKVVQILEDNAISYCRLVMESDFTPTIFGFAMKMNGQKAVDYIIGFLITSEHIGKIEVLDEFNAYYHILSKDTNSQIILDKFSDAQGNADKLKDIFDFTLYHDNNFSIISVFYPDEKTEFLENILIDL